VTAEPRVDVAEALSTGYFVLRDQLTVEQLDCLARTRRFVGDSVLPTINTSSVSRRACRQGQRLHPAR
jgi:hypothetical protein